MLTNTCVMTIVVTVLRRVHGGQRQVSG